MVGTAGAIESRADSPTRSSSPITFAVMNTDRQHCGAAEFTARKYYGDSYYRYQHYQPKS
jgi:hypothetical protein